ncbi:hypothetical protein [Gordonia sp. (in: high G+C Gram-positive bacteria)]|uniref:hypothetical protein n=1 Tax=Gordonia sp. (in: high G+C Gram-positive bacteria) TaxID=84139 RepID=UPI0016A34106|nr:hypothetical protein [Gordonia sp. (in: high G+C Gram-positive bacteria)]NLG48071.1 hypothetical protein [Gordonia sp. (in: high G+C Gram-positive bacteria)]
MAFGARAVDSPRSAGSQGTLRSDLMLLALAVVAVGGTHIHNHQDVDGTSLGPIVYWAPVVVYVGLALLAFIPRFRSAASWALMVCAWVMVVIVLVGVLPRGSWQSSFENSHHYLMHTVVLIAQIPMIVMLVRRLNGEACRWTAPRQHPN